ncbi:MAG: zf-HC2 domain-containing protein [Anaerolineae bacterium]|nr:zf-HC2 domain-containing protein [Anaerolineae bacterium]
MKCDDLRQLFAAYLDNEATPLEQLKIRKHIAECMDCRNEISMLARLQSHLDSGLKAEAAQVEPSSQAWERLQARLANEPISPLECGNGFLSRLGLSRSEHREAHLKQPTTKGTPRDWLWALRPVNQREKLIWAARWLAGSKTRRCTSKKMNIQNSRDDKPFNTTGKRKD